MSTAPQRNPPRDSLLSSGIVSVEACHELDSMAVEALRVGENSFREEADD